MEKRDSPTSRKAAAARANGRKGGTKSPDISRWNAVKHALTASKLTIREGRHLLEYGDFAAMHAQLVKELRPSTIDEAVSIDKYVTDAWRLARAFRFELSATEKANGFLSPAMANILRYMSTAERQYQASSARIQEIRERKQAAAVNEACDEAADDLEAEGEQFPESNRPAAGECLQFEPLEAILPQQGTDNSQAEQERPRAFVPAPEPLANTSDGDGGKTQTTAKPMLADAVATTVQNPVSTAELNSTGQVEGS